MKILHIGVHFNPLLGGGNLRNSELVRHSLKEFNDEIYIITKVEEGYEGKLPEYLKTSPDFRNVHCYLENSSMKQVMLAIKLNRKVKFDVIHFHNQRVAFMGGYFFKKQKMVLEFHALLNLDSWKDRLFRKVINKMAHFIVLGENGKDMLLKMYNGIDQARVTVVRNGSNPVVVGNGSKRILDPQYFWIAYIGTFYPWQGVYDFLEACQLFIKQYTDTPVRFIMVGGGPCFEDIKGKINAFGSPVREHILLTGTVSPTEVSDYWSDIDVAVLPRPSTRETESTEPLKLHEAINYEKIILATNVGGFKSLLKPDYNALLSTPGNNRELVDNYYRVYKDIALREKLVDNTRETKQRLVTWAEAARKVQSIYAS